jgi:hypothetical protein
MGKYANWKKEQNAKYNNWKKEQNAKHNNWKKEQNAKHNNWKEEQQYNGVCGKYIKRYDKKVKDVLDREKQIKELTELNNKYKNTNDRVIKSNNALLDTTQFFDNTLFGNNKTDGYVQALVKSNIQNSEILNQKVGQTIKPFEGFSMFDRIDNENTVIQNQINKNTEQHSVDNQKYRNLNNQIEFLNKANEILGWILFAVIIICALVIWGSNETLTHKLVMIKVVWLYLIFVEILEYVLFYVYRYVNALLFGQPYNSADFWKFPHLTWIDIGIIILIVLSVFI